MKTLSLILAVVLLSSSAFAQKKIVCYIDAEISVDQVNPSLCTHIIYSFLGLDQNGGLNYLQRSEQEVLSYLQGLVGLKSSNPGLNIVVAIGGWNENLVPVWSSVAGDQNARQNLANNVLNFLQSNNLNGIDIDWENPNFDGKAPQDKANFITLLQTLKQTIGSDYSLSTAIGTGAWRTDLSYDIAGIFEAVDFVNVMTYDLHGGWETITGIHAALYSSALDNTDSNVDAAVKLIMSRGGLAEKLIMGIPTYGNAFSLSDSNQNGVGAPATGAGSWKFNQICQRTNDGSLNYVWDDDQKVPYAFAGNDWVGYDDVKSVTEKAKYINDNNFGGAMIWDIDSDDYSNVCGLGNYPLISAIHNNIARGQVARREKNDFAKEPQSKYSMRLNLEVSVETKGKITPGMDKFQSEVLNFFFKTKKIGSKTKQITFPWMK